jgi:hypothetical protein
MAIKAAKPTATAAVSKEKIKPETLPVDIGGGDIKYLKRSEYAKRTAENFAIKTKAEIKKDHVTQCLDALDAGQDEITGEVPDEFRKLFDLVKEDYEAGVEEVERIQQEEAEKKAAAEKAEKERAEKEEKLFLAVKDEKADFSTIAKNFDTGNMDRFVPKKDATVEDIFAALNASFGMSEFTSWMQGDIVVELEKRGQLNVVSKVAEAHGQSYSTLYRKSRTSAAFPPEKRVKGVSYTICAEVALAKFTKEQEPEKEKLIQKVLEGKVNTQEVRAEVQKIQGKGPEEPKLPEEDEKFEFICVNPQADDITKMVLIAKGFPKELHAEGWYVINPKTKKQFAKNGFKKDAKNRWEDLDPYIKVEAKTDATDKKKKK